MNYAIIAAGEGSRLASEGVKYPKPLIPLNGVPIIERLIGIFMRCHAKSISIITNSKQPKTVALLRKLQKDLPLNIVVKDTPSSMHSLYELTPYLRNDRFCLTTVDTLFREEEFKEYINTFIKSNNKGLMGITDYIDDEKPLYVSTDNMMHITGFHDTAPEHIKYISGGIYCLPPEALVTLENCIKSGQSRMRNFQRQLITDNISLDAYPFGKIIDIDHASDIEKAEKFIQQI